MAFEMKPWISILAVLPIVYILTKHLLHNLRRLPPTPFPILPIIGHLHLLKNPLHRSLANLSQTHGPVLLLRFGSRTVLHVASSTAAEECLSKNDVVFANRPRLLAGKYFGYNYTSLPWAPYGQHWRSLRRISAMEILSSARLNSLSHIRLDEIRSMVLRLFIATGESPDQTVNLRSELFVCMFNVMTRMMGGKKYFGDGGDLEEGKRFSDIINDTEQVISESKILDLLPSFQWLFAGKFEKRFAVIQKRRDGFMQDWIDELRADGLGNNGESKKTLLQVLLSLQQEDPEYYTDEMIKSLSQALLHGGTNTTIDTMEWAMTHLLNNPHILIKAQNEIDHVVGCDRLVNETDLSKLPFLQCIIKETLRMHPGGPLLLPHESSKECIVGGYHIPRGTMLFVNVWAIQNDPHIWDSPNMFIPERFEGKESITKTKKDGLSMIPFGSGRRQCPGIDLAFCIVGLVMASIIQCFDWKHVSEGLVDMSETGGFTARKAQPLVAKYRARSIVEHHLSQMHLARPAH